jgi:hypothetical protein
MLLPFWNPKSYKIQWVLGKRSWACSEPTRYVLLFNLPFHNNFRVGFFMPLLQMRRGWGFSSVKESLPGKCKALSSVPSTGKKKKRQIQMRKVVHIEAQ